MRNKERRKILDIERSLGFKWERGVSRKKGLGCDVLTLFLSDVEVLKKKFVDFTTIDLRASDDFAQRCEDLFRRHGPRLWPSYSVERFDWLVDAEENDWGGAYTRNLEYEDPTHVDELRRNFRDLLLEKCVRYRQNCKQKLRRDGVMDGQEDDLEDYSEHTLEISNANNYSFNKDITYSFPPQPARRLGARRVRPSARVSYAAAGPQSAFEVPNQFVAPVAPMIPETVEEQTYAAPIERGMSVRGDSTRNFLSQGSFGVDPKHHEQPPVRATGPLPVSTRSSPDSVPFRPPYNVSRSSERVGHKHTRSHDSENENTSRKTTKSAYDSRGQLESIVTLKVDPKKLASIGKHPASTTSARRTARKRPVSYAAQSRDDPDTSGSEDIEVMTFATFNRSREGSENVRVANYRPPSVSTVDDENFVDQANILSPTRSTTAVPSHAEMRPRPSVGTDAAAAKSPLDHPPYTAFEKRRVQSPVDTEYVFQSISGETSDNEEESMYPTHTLESHSEQYHESNAVRKIEVVDLTSDIIPASPTFTHVDIPMADIPSTQGSVKMGLPQVSHIQSLEPQDSVQEVSSASFRQGSTTAVSHETESPETPRISHDVPKSPPSQTTPGLRESVCTPQPSNLSPTTKESKIKSPHIESTTNPQPRTALETARTRVCWDTNSDFPSFIYLHHCQTHKALFDELLRHRPDELEHRVIKAVEVQLTNAEAAGITDSPNCRILAENDQAGFDNLVDTLAEYTPSVRPKLVLMVKFQKEVSC